MNPFSSRTRPTASEHGKGKPGVREDVVLERGEGWGILLLEILGAVEAHRTAQSPARMERLRGRERVRLVMDEDDVWGKTAECPPKTRTVDVKGNVAFADDAEADEITAIPGSRARTRSP